MRHYAEYSAMPEDKARILVEQFNFVRKSRAIYSIKGFDVYCRQYGRKTRFFLRRKSPQRLILALATWDQLLARLMFEFEEVPREKAV